MTRLLTRIIFALTFIVMVSAMTSCRKAPINGDFDGMWQLMTVDRDGESKTIPPTQFYFKVSLHTAHLGSLTGNMTYVKNESVTLEFPYATASQLSRVYLTPEEVTLQSDVTGNPDAKGFTVTYSIRLVNSTSLVMESVTGTIFTFRRY